MNLFAGQSRDAMREAWRIAWQRHCGQLPLEPLQRQMVEVIAMHPEYHALLTVIAPSESAPAADAFLHLGLHLALREQLSTDRPRGISAVHRRLATAHGEAHPTEHRMIDVLARTLWEAQRAGQMPDERSYLEALHRL